MKTTANHVLIKLDKTRDDTFTTKSGMTFYVPTMAIDPNDPNTETDADAIRTYGVVAATPWKLTKSMMVPVVVRKGNREQMRTVADIVPEVEVGDKIHFRYSAIDRIENRIYNEDGMFQAIPYSDIFAREVDGQVIPIGSFVFVEPIKEKIAKSDHLIIPDDFTKKTNRGIVKWIGKPFKDEAEIGVEPGDEVVYDTKYAERQKVNDEWYEVIYQDDIMLKV